jgi:outer membrane protein assembly factor BamA
MGFPVSARFAGRCGALLPLIGALACTSVPKDRAAVDAVDFQGVQEVNSSDLSKKIATAQSPKFLGVFEGVVYEYELFDPFALQKDLERVERYYRARGFYQAHVRAGRVVYTSANHVRVHVVVEEGPPVLVGAVQLEGLQQVPIRVQRDVEESLRVAGLKPGNRFDEDQYAGAQWHIEHALQDDAYAFAHVERSARVDVRDHLAEVVYRVTPDQPSTFGKITVEGLESLPLEPVLRALDIREGAVYSATALEHAQQAALDLGVFSSVTVTPERSDPPPPDRAVPLIVRVTPTRLRSVIAGGGLELDVIKTDLHVTGGWTNDNLFGGLRRFDVEFRPGLALYPTRLPDLEKPTDFLPEERLRLQLSQPGFIEARTTGYLRSEFNVYPLLLTSTPPAGSPVVGYREARAGAGVSRVFWKLFAELGYDLQYNSPFTYIGTLDPDLRTAVVSYVHLRTTLDFRNDAIEPHEGVYLSNDLQFAGGPLAGQAEDFRILPDVRGYVPLGPATLALRATTGLLFPANYGNSLGLAAPGVAPPGVDQATYVRDLQLVYFRGFFSGGPGSNRGYPLYGVGPHGPVPFLLPNINQQIASQCVPGLGIETLSGNRCFQPLGGLTMWAVSAEVRYPLSSEFTEATFCDASDVEEGRAHFVLDTHLSCGIGLRYKTPVGPVRLDVAYRIPGLNPAPGDPDYPGDIAGLPIGVAFGIGEAY